MKKYVFLLCGLVGLLSVSCTKGEEPLKPLANHIVYIGLDGWGSFSVEKADMPFVKSLLDEGCWTMQKRSVLPSSSAVNWASMFMGAGPELHGYTDWGSKTPELPSRVILKNNIFPTIFQVLREAEPEAEIGVMSDWDGIKYVVDTLSCNFVSCGLDYVNHPDTLCRVAEKYIVEKQPKLVAVCFDQPDHIGHGGGFGTPEYHEVLTQLDGYVKRIFEAVKEAGMYDDTIFIVTADHGGINKGHGGKTMDEMETPFIILGKNIKKGGEFSESMMQYDVAATMAHIFRLTPPQVWIGRPMLQVFQ